ncbi:MAG: hypothetical protein EP330_14250 [Deltaproteobacteria bacterium]|nr:MAG: hypothetical protein EP330_14250 [Deltaproteobacteria bacterium]
MRILTALSLALLVGCSTPEGGDPTDTGVETGSPDAEDPWFTLMVIPDIQYLTNDLDSYGVLGNMMDWIVDHKDELNIAMVVQEGDITHQNDVPAWEVADAAFAKLDGVVPYAVCVGNHDMDTTSREAVLYNQYFGLDRWRQHETFYASASEDSADDHAHVFSAGGVDWMILSLKYSPRDEALTWAEQLVADHPDHRIIVLTHAYLTPSGTTSTQGDQLQARIVDPFPNVELVLNGHFLGDVAADRRRARDDGSEVLELFSNYQDLLLAGFGRMRQMRIDPAAGTIDVQTCNVHDVCSEDDGDTLTFADLDLGL